MTPDELLQAIADMLSAPSISPIDYQYWYNLKQRRIIFNNYCDEALVETIVLPLQQMERESKDPIELIINTGGGAPFELFILCNVIDMITCPLHIIIYGKAYSAGIYLAMAGYNNPNVTKSCYPFSLGLIHGGTLVISGQRSQCKETMNFMDTYEATIKKYVLSHTLISEEEYVRREKEEWFLNAQDMLRLGIVNNILE